MERLWRSVAPAPPMARDGMAVQKHARNVQVALPSSSTLTIATVLFPETRGARRSVQDLVRISPQQAHMLPEIQQLCTVLLI
jgi:hypothetical protein